MSEIMEISGLKSHLREGLILSTLYHPKSIISVKLRNMTAYRSFSICKHIFLNYMLIQ